MQSPLSLLACIKIIIIYNEIFLTFFFTNITVLLFLGIGNFVFKHWPLSSYQGYINLNFAGVPNEEVWEEDEYPEGVRGRQQQHKEELDQVHQRVQCSLDKQHKSEFFQLTKGKSQANSYFFVVRKLKRKAVKRDFKEKKNIFKKSVCKFFFFHHIYFQSI